MHLSETDNRQRTCYKTEVDEELKIADSRALHIKPQLNIVSGLKVINDAFIITVLMKPIRIERFGSYTRAELGRVMVRKLS